MTHPHITSDPQICGGSPCLTGTRVTVRTMVIAGVLHGLTSEEVLQHYPHVTLVAIHDALSYYYDHREIAEHVALDPGLGLTPLR